MTYRVHVPRISYRGGDPRKRAKVAEDAALCALIEEEIQRRYDAIDPGQMQSILAHSVAYTIGRDCEKVRRIMCRMQGGSNGVTYSKNPLPGETWDHLAPAKPAERGPSDAMTTDRRLQLGMRVRHKIFGNGMITHISGERVAADFGDGDEKAILGSFLEPL